MSNHYSAANLKFPGDDARLDVTDLWVFPAVDAGKTVIVMDVNPFTTGMNSPGRCSTPSAPRPARPSRAATC
jgi:hypothetical protein